MPADYKTHFTYLASHNMHKNIVGHNSFYNTLFKIRPLLEITETLYESKRAMSTLINQRKHSEIQRVHLFQTISAL